MLFFRSEEDVREWCRAGGHPLRPRVTMDQLWGLAHAWYSNRLTRAARRPAYEEMREIFAGLGLEGDFWDTRADDFEGTGGADA